MHLYFTKLFFILSIALVIGCGGGSSQGRQELNISEAMRGSVTALPQVDQIDISAILNNSTWKHRSYSRGVVNGDDIITTTSDEISHLSVSNGNILIRSCLSDRTTGITPDFFGQSFVDQTSSNCDKIFYQDDKALRFELRCDDNITRLAQEFTKISDAKLTNFGSFSLDFEFRPDLDETNEVCGGVFSRSFVNESSSNTPIFSSTTSIGITSLYQAEPFEINLIVDGELSNPVTMSISNDSQDSEDIETVFIISDLPRLRDLIVSEEAEINLGRSNLTELEGDFTAAFFDNIGATESAAGEFNFSFRPLD